MKQTIKIKVPKDNKYERYYKPLGTIVLNHPMSPPSLPTDTTINIWIEIKTLQEQLFIELMKNIQII